MNAITEPVRDQISRQDLLDALRRDVGKPSGANLGRRAKATDAHALAMLAVRYPKLAEALNEKN